MVGKGVLRMDGGGGGFAIAVLWWLVLWRFL